MKDPVRIYAIAHGFEDLLGPVLDLDLTPAEVDDLEQLLARAQEITQAARARFEECLRS